MPIFRGKRILRNSGGYSGSDNNPRPIWDWSNKSSEKTWDWEDYEANKSKIWDWQKEKSES